MSPSTEAMVHAAERLLSLITPSPKLRAIQLHAFRHGLELKEVSDKDAIFSALFDATGFPSVFEVDEDDADDFVSRLQGIAANWDHIVLGWNGQDLDEDALYAHSLPALMSMVSNDALPCGLALWAYRHQAWEGATRKRWRGWIARAEDESEIRSLTTMLGIPIAPWPDHLPMSTVAHPSPTLSLSVKAIANGFNFHPSLKKVVMGNKEWLADPDRLKGLQDDTAVLKAFADEPISSSTKALNRLQWFEHYYGIAACDAYSRGDATALASFMGWTVSFQSLNLRVDGMFSEMRPDLGNWPREFRDSMRAAGPVMLSRWDEATVCTERLGQMVEQDQRVNTLDGARRIKQGTSDAFLVHLFSQAFGIETGFKPAKSLVSEYQILLDNWQIIDESAFRDAMQAAAEFHISRSKDDTDRSTYEFHYGFDRLFPAELLAVQALRRRDGLPGFDTGHLLIDAPWAIVRDLPKTEPHPLAVAVETRLKQDYPQFR